HHLRLLVSDSLLVRDNKDNKIFIFKKSLEGDAAMWFGSLPIGSSRANTPTLPAKNLPYRTSKTPLKVLMNICPFIRRFKEHLVKMEVVKPKSQAIQMIIQNLRDPLGALMLLGPIRTYVKLYQRASQLERNF
ncbi:conserved hypothetical protein, partial [Ricinus communis]